MESKDNHDARRAEDLFQSDPDAYAVAFIAEHGIPPMAGADDGDADNDAGAETPVEGGASDGAETPPDEAGDSDPSSGDDEVFRLDDVPDEIREPVGRLQKQMQSALTRARQRDREQLAEAQEAMELLARLNDPEQAGQALEELAEQLGYEPAAGDIEEGDEDGGDDPLAELPDEVREKLSAVDELRAAEEARVHERRVSIIRDHVEEGIQELVGEEGQASDDVREIYTLTALAHRGEDGLPNTERAAELVESIQAEAVQRYLDGVRRGGGAAPDASGSSGVSQGDATTPEGRRELAMKIAARHLGG